MPIVTQPTVVQNAMDAFIAKFFINQPQRDHVANDLTGLMICPNKTVTGKTSAKCRVQNAECFGKNRALENLAL